MPALLLPILIATTALSQTGKATPLADLVPLRVDINSEDRADMRTAGWENWRPAGGDMSQSFGDLTVTLRTQQTGAAADQDLQGSAGPNYS